MSMNVPIEDFLEALTVADLEQMRGTIDQRIREKRENNLSDAIQEIERVVAKHGFAMHDVMARIDARVEGPVKWRHPMQPDLIWCGRGRRPRWMTAALKAGIALPDMRA